MTTMAISMAMTTEIITGGRVRRCVMTP